MISRVTGIPLTKSGRQRKTGKAMTGGGCSLVLGAIILRTIALLGLVTVAFVGR